MNILLEHGLPDKISGVPIMPDFRNMIRFEAILQDEELTPYEKTEHGLRQLFKQIPQGFEQSIKDLVWFYMRGAEQAKRTGNRKARAYDFSADASYIYSAFYASYGINLTTVRFLHWWEFMALLEGLPESTMMAKIMGYRTMDINKIQNKEVREQYLALQNQWALKSNHYIGKSVEEIQTANKEKWKRRFEEAQKSTRGG
ncbi:MAG: bacteriophage Gp15 family protein [Oscillospiraceae bacterium]